MHTTTYYRKYGKRQLDFVVALLALLVLLPFLLVLGIVIRLAQGGPVIFSQVRPGYLGQPFRMFKFRTMTDARDESGQLLPDTDRLTKIGGFLRRTSLDELPELINVLRGEMSLIGPRPLLMEYLERYTPDQARRHEVRPGITGLAQISGRQEIPFSRRLELDVEYVMALSLRFDLEILAKTILRVFHRRGVVLGQEVSEVDDLGLSRDLQSIAARSEGKQRDH